MFDTLYSHQFSFVRKRRLQSTNVNDNCINILEINVDVAKNKRYRCWIFEITTTQQCGFSMADNLLLDSYALVRNTAYT